MPTPADREAANRLLDAIEGRADTEQGVDICAETLASYRERTEQQMYPIFDILPRLWASGHLTFEKDGEWILLDGFSEVVMTGKTFRELCVNIVL